MVRSTMEGRMVIVLIVTSFILGMVVGMFLVSLMIRNIASRNGGRYTFYLEQQLAEPVRTAVSSIHYGTR
jgi:hypothetical protein